MRNNIGIVTEEDNVNAFGFDLAEDEIELEVMSMSNRESSFA